MNKVSYLAVAIALLAPFSVALAADNVTLTPGVTYLNVSTLGLNYGIDTGTRGIQSFSTLSDHIEFTVNPGAILILTSADRSKFTVTNSQCTAPTVVCDSTRSRITIDCTSPNVTQHTLSVTPGPGGSCGQNSGGVGITANGSTASGGGGGGSDGGGAGSSNIVTPPSIPNVPEAPPAVAPATPAAPAANAPSAVPEPAIKPGQGQIVPVTPLRRSSIVFKKTMGVGSKGSDVLSLQKILQQLVFLSSSIKANGYFGNSTKAAVRKFQKANGIKTTGIVNKETLKALNAIVSGGAVIQQQPPSQPAATPPYKKTFKKALRKGSRGTAVKALQQKLKDLGYFPTNFKPTTTFGPGTVKALQNYQNDKALTPSGSLDAATSAQLNG